MSLEQALAGLRNPDAQARVYAIRWLRVLGGPRAVNALIGALDDPDPYGGVPFSAITALGQVRAQGAVPILMERVQRKRPAAWRGFYIGTLGEIGDRRALPVLIASLEDPDESIVKAACGALGKVKDPGAVPALIAALERARELTMEAAFSALAEIGDHKAVPALIAALDAPDGRTAEAACGALLRLGAWEAVGALMRLVNDPRARVRFGACEALFELGVSDDRLPAALEELALDKELNSPAPRFVETLSTAIATAETLGQAPRHDNMERLGTLAQRMGEQRSRCRQMIRELARRQVGEGHAEADLPAEDEEAPEAVPALIWGLLSDDSEQVRSTCAWELGRFPGEHVSEALRQALADPDTDVIHHASCALGNRRDRSAIPRLLPLLGHPDRRNRLSVAKALVKLQAADPRLVSTLESLAQDPEADEHNLEVLEFNAELGQEREWADKTGEPEPQPRLTMAEMIEQARRSLVQAAQ